MNRLIYRTFIFCCFIGSFCMAAPEPSIIPVRGQWTLDVEFTHLQPIILDTIEGGNPIRFWYTIFTVTNNTGNDVDFFPNCQLLTNTFEIEAAGAGVSPTVFQYIKKRHQSEYPFLESLSNVGNRILEGEDNAKDIAVIWSDFDHKASSIKVFITGLSNETAAVNLPVFQNDTLSQKQVFLRKTLEISYSVMGDPTGISSRLEYTGKRWIMR